MTRLVRAADGPGVLLRSALFNAYFFALTFVLCLAGVPLRWMAPWRTAVLARLWAQLAVAGLRWFCGIRLLVLGREHLPPHGPMLIAAEHQSAFDTIVWHLLVPAPAYVVKRELMRLPLFGPLLRHGGQIGLDRAAGAAALRGLVRETERAVAEGRPVVIFPQGTRTPPGERVPLQPGIAAQAARTHLPVIPVATEFGPLLAAPRISQASGHDPDYRRAADPARARARRAAGANRGGVAGGCGASLCISLWIGYPGFCGPAQTARPNAS